MRVLFVTFPWRTHFYLKVPLAWALRTAGHEVHVASSPEFMDVITGAGLTAVSVGSDESIREKGDKLLLQAARSGVVLPKIDHDENREEVLTWENLKSYYTISAMVHRATNDSMVEDLVAYCRWWRPDLVVWEWMSYAGSIAAAAVGLPHARTQLGLDVGSRLRATFQRLRAQQPPEDCVDPLAEWLGTWGAKYGFDASEELLTGQFAIDQMPDSMRLASELRQVSFRHIPYHGPSVMPEWTRREPAAPRVLATFGVSMWNVAGSQPIAGQQIQEMLDSMGDLDIELVVTAPERVQRKLKRVPENTKLVDFVPLHAILPSCAAVIHHGGIPAFCGALSHGVPQVMVSRTAPDARERGERLQRAQAGVWIPPEEMSGARLRKDLVRLLEDVSFRSGAERMSREMLAQPTPNDVVPELEKLAAEYGRR